MNCPVCATLLIDTAYCTICGKQVLYCSLWERVKELEAEVESANRAAAAINQALNEGDGSYRP